MMKLNIPKIDEEPLSLMLEDGDQLFVVGANGSGKSALLQHWISSDAGGKISRISAHRQTWFESGGINLTPAGRRGFDESNRNMERRGEARWKDYDAAGKQSSVLFDLVERENFRARNIALHVDGGNTEEARKVAAESVSPFDRINELLERATLDVSIENSENGEILAHRRDSEQAFSIAQMSDGERNALIVAATVLTVKPGTVLLIDEPERHLHRSIIEPFLSALLQCRDDCAFVVSTHEIALPVANPNARVLMLRSCAWKGNRPKAWDVELLEPNDGLPDELKFAILGARKRILFVEGTRESLDSLYAALFPGLSVVPKGGCRDVMEAVKGLRGSYELHHVEAFGLIDRDDRTHDQVRKLVEGNVFALEVFSVEALYYCSDSIEAVASRQAGYFDLEADELIESGKAKAFDSILRDDDIAERMSARKCKSRLRDKILSDLPDCNEIQTAKDPKVSVRVDSGYADELSRFKKLVDEKKLDDLIARYPFRKSRVFDAIAKALRCPGKKEYERMVLSMVRKDQNQDLTQAIRKRIGPLADKLETGPA